MSTEVYTAIGESFDSLPLAAILSGNFCVHGGISILIQNEDDLNHLEKKVVESRENVATDFLWSDPQMFVEEFEESPRGCGRLFGQKALAQFLARTGTSRLIRAHETCDEGYDFPFLDESALTLFSSCDYCQQRNDAAVAMVLEDGQILVERFPPLLEAKRRPPQFPLWCLINSVHLPIPLEIEPCTTEYIEV
jgi:protein phosphatase